MKNKTYEETFDFMSRCQIRHTYDEFLEIVKKM